MTHNTTNADIVIYTSAMCGYCARAIRLLDSKQIAYREVDVTLQPALRQEMRRRSGGRNSVPQMFVNDKHLGDCTEIYALEAAGQLDSLLAS